MRPVRELCDRVKWRDQEGKKEKKGDKRKRKKKERFLTFVLDVEVEEFGFRGNTECVLRSR